MIKDRHTGPLPDRRTPVDAASTPDQLVADLVQLLDVEHLDTDLYRGFSRPGDHGRVFGGQVIAQGLVAAMRSVDGEGEQDKGAHSLHAYFVRPGDEHRPIMYRVERDLDGRSFSNRRVVASQGASVILDMAVSFHRGENGVRHQIEMPQAPSPDTIASEAEALRMEDPDLTARIPWLNRPRPIDFRPVRPRAVTNAKIWPAYNQIWFRTVAPLPDDPDLHRAALAFASDNALLSTSLLPHGIGWATPGFQSASLDHALWLHEPSRVDDWLLYVTDSPWANDARSFNRGHIFSRDGRLVASVAQEALIRVRGAARDGASV